MSKSAIDRDYYPSRIGGLAAIRERIDPVVHGPPRGALDAAARENFDRDGYLSLPELLGPSEVEALDAELNTLRNACLAEPIPEQIYEPESRAIRSIFAVHKLSPKLDALLRGSRILPIVRELLGSEVYVHQSRVNYKPGFEGKEFYWHSDFETWHVEDGMPRMRALSLSINLTENTQVNGPLMVVPGSHKHYVSCPGLTPKNHHEKSLRKQEYGVPPRSLLTGLVKQGGIEAQTGPAGAAVIFDCNIMHGSSGNITPWGRSNVFVVFNSVENALRAPFAGLAPRPEHIAHRDFTPLTAA